MVEAAVMQSIKSIEYVVSKCDLQQYVYMEEALDKHHGIGGVSQCPHFYAFFELQQAVVYHPPCLSPCLEPPTLSVVPPRTLESHSMYRHHLVP